MSDTLRVPLTRQRVALDDDGRGGLSRIQRGERFGRVLTLLALVPLLAVAGLVVIHAVTTPTMPVVVALAVLAIGGVIALVAWTRRELLEPMRLTREWAAGMCSGDLSTRIGAVRSHEFSRLVFHINRLSSALDMLANEMDDTVSHQTDRLAQRNSAIEMLYEVASTLNEPGDVRSILASATQRLLDLVEGRGAVLRNVDDRERLVAECHVLAGFPGEEGPTVRTGVTAAQDGADTTTGDPGPIADRLGKDTVQGTAAEFGYADVGDAAAHVIRIPLRYRQRSVGAIDLFMATLPSPDIDLLPLFASVGKHLGVAMEKARLEAEARALVRVRERTALAHELHDSLAQTLAGLRMQVRMLAETLQDDDLDRARSEVERVGNVVEEAHTELRELLGNFTAPIDERGILSALTELVDRARRDSHDTAVFLQHEGPEPELSAAAQLQAVRIVGEALANVRKHADARAVRVMMRHVPGDSVTLLVEDDGSGFAPGTLGGRMGENLGLTIMRERAQRAGGELLIESEPGEGTRVELWLPASAEEKEGETSP